MLTAGEHTHTEHRCQEEERPEWRREGREEPGRMLKLRLPPRWSSAGLENKQQSFRRRVTLPFGGHANHRC